MKKIVTAILCSLVFSMGTKAQFSFLGTWEGTQTNMQGYYPADVVFIMDPNREFDILDKATNSIKYRGTYTDSGYYINGKYTETIGSTSYIHFFTGTYDPATQKLNMTFGNNPKNYWLGKWTVTKKHDWLGGLRDDRSYILQSAKVTLGTGNDNKDKGAQVTIRVYPRREGFQPEFKGYSLVNYTDELKKWQWQTLNLPQAERYQESSNNLGWYEQYGLGVDIWLDTYGGPFPLTDAWKLDKVIVDLQFADAGTLHPKYGNVHIEFPGSSVLFNKKTCKLTLTTDGNFKPLAPKVFKDCKN